MGVRLIENEIRSALNLPLIEITEHKISGCWCEMVVHGRCSSPGILREIKIDNDILNKYVKLLDISAKPGDAVMPFTGGNMALGDIFFKFDSREELDEIISMSDKWLNIILE